MGIGGIAVALAILLSGCVVEAPGETILRDDEPCSHGVCLPSRTAMGDWTPVLNVTDQALWNEMVGISVHDGRVAWTDHNDGHPAAIRTFDGTRLTQHHVKWDGDHVSVLGESAGYLLIGSGAWWRPSDSLYAVAPSTGDVVRLDGEEILLVDSGGVQALVSWLDNEEEVVATWTPREREIQEVMRREIQEPRIVGAVDGDGTLLVDHRYREQSDLLDRTIRRIGPLSWESMLEPGLGITAIAPTESGFVTLAHTHAYHRHHHSYARSNPEITFYGADARPHETVNMQRGAPISWTTLGGLVLGGHDTRYLVQDGVGADFPAHGYDAARHQAYWIHDGHLWQAPAGTPLPDSWSR